LTGDIYTSVSGDGGESWSRNQRINVTAQPEVMVPPSLAARRGGGAYVQWQQVRGETRRCFIRRITPGEPGAAPADTVSLSSRPMGPLIQPLPERRLLIQERFDQGSLGGVRPLAGSWVVRGGVLLGFGFVPAFAELTDHPLRDFTVAGVFEGYFLRNHFRRGVMLSRTRFEIAPGRPPAILGTEPIGDRWFPLRQDTWYTFRVAVRGPRLDYRLDDSWVLSADGLDARPGVVVLGADPRGPVEWDDLALHAFAEGATENSDGE
jgi:hypothetical protein